ncbi:ScbA/BarX family gamma-butyrolactone biosynthesis protein [Kitasatospora sp. NPDC005751]|uniref:ScbA/BarX family gamma-butyrolactone biosynthesis protein n=1 Tax=Kitasatospora sp. NPDC005751 TaxID=3157064 RepID=UPI0033DB098E
MESRPTIVQHTAATRTRPSVPPEMPALVGKSVAGEALVTDWGDVSGATQWVTVHWPHDHPFYTEGGRYSPLLFTESARQALTVLSHAVHGVPLGHRFGMERIRTSVNSGELLTTSGPPEVDLLITHTSVTRRRLGSAHLVSQVEARRGGRHLGTAELHYTSHPPALYDRLRGRYADAAQAFARALPLLPPAPTAVVGRLHERDVVISPAGAPDHWQLRTDTGHRVLFDHPHDHVPGMVLLEAAVQATRATLPHPAVPVAFDSTFLRYVEFDQPCLLTTTPAPPTPDGHPRTHIRATQSGTPVFTTTLTTEPHPA